MNCKLHSRMQLTIQSWIANCILKTNCHTDIICFQTCIKGTVFLDFFTTYHLWRLMKKDVMFYCHIFIYWVYQMYRTAKWKLQLYRLLLHSPSKFRNCLTKCTGWVFCRKTKIQKQRLIYYRQVICFHISHPNESPNIPDFHIIFLIPMNHQTLFWYQISTSDCVHKYFKFISKEEQLSHITL